MAKLATPASGSKTLNPSAHTNGHARSAALEAVSARPRHKQRRPTKQASYELTNHAKAYLEGGQYASGYDFLYSLLAAGTSISRPAQPYIGFLAPPAYIAFASSMVADPRFTTKAQSRDAAKGSNTALRYLQCVHTTIDDPAYPTIRKAFMFPRERNRRSAPSYRASASLSPQLSSDIKRIAGEAANEKSLWYRADDFWHAVGWAFNCAIKHKKRWNRWKPWLRVMLDFLEADWDVCVKQSNQEGASDETTLQQSLLWHYITGDETAMNRAKRRRIIRAVLATATPDSLKDYPEVWERETAEPRRKRNEDQPVGEVDFETGELADYGSDEDMQDASDDGGDESGDDTSSQTSDTGIRNVHDAIERLGGQDAIKLRQRLIALLAQVAVELPELFTRIYDLCDNILEEFSQVPTMTFQVLLSTMKLPDDIRVAFTANLLHGMIASKPPSFFLRDPLQQDFEKTLLPLKGTTQSFAANTKISLILEQLFMHMMKNNALAPNPALRKAMEAGIQARRSVYGTGKGKRGNAEEEEQAKKLLQESSDRLLGLLEVLEMAHGKTPQSTRVKESALLSFGSGSSLSPAPDSETEPED
ncbi:hypothetical protein J4E85_007154 [Alternaria conjuncta]|uniref:uncharacterized protein n=1 Tax=Alternaria conjuncta TaxID=181017 RepID=UPI00221FECBB|nr:uncharacterized protein J4E85_007154 [Alternaria conjuncta]KAI4925277.1 hypothetical protein J4E85_007154 [Alternaria conjuncta]